MTKFYKGTMESMLNDSFHPKNVTTDINVAVKQMERISSTPACVVEIRYNGPLYNYFAYKKETILGHDDISGYTNEEHTKAIINNVCIYHKLSKDEIAELMNKQIA